MKNPLRDLSRPKALGLAGVAAGALTASAAAAALNVGLLSAHEKPAFAPTPVAESGEVMLDTTTTQAPVVVYEDVYDHVPAPAVTPAAPAPTSGQPAPSGASSGAVRAVEPDDSNDQSVESEDHESEDHESESHESEDHESEDDRGFDD